MSKLTYDDKINLYNDRKNGMSIKSLSIKYNIRTKNVQYICCLIEKHRIDILRTCKNKVYTKYEKQEAINRILINNESVWSVALDIGLSGDGKLLWIIKD